MSRYIDADAAIYQLSKWAMLDSQPRAFKRCITYLNAFADKQPADVQEVRHARWEEDETSGFLCCSNCGTREPYFKNYEGPLSDDSDPERVTYWACPFCPMCGAWIDLEDKS